MERGKRVKDRRRQGVGGEKGEGEVEREKEGGERGGGG